jgi:hypothetical protein
VRGFRQNGTRQTQIFAAFGRTLLLQNLYHQNSINTTVTPTLLLMNPTRRLQPEPETVRSWVRVPSQRGGQHVPGAPTLGTNKYKYDRGALHQLLWHRRDHLNKVTVNCEELAVEIGASSVRTASFVRELVAQGRLTLLHRGHYQIGTYIVIDPLTYSVA